MANIDYDKPAYLDRVRTKLAAKSRATPDGCIIWTGRGNGQYGYGSMSFRGRRVGVHRLAWMLRHGPVPDGLYVLHRCDTPPCLNPDHLFLGTKADNSADMVAKGRSHNQRKTHCPQGHEYSEANTYRWRTSRICRTCTSLRRSAKTLEVD